MDEFNEMPIDFDETDSIEDVEGTASSLDDLSLDDLSSEIDDCADSSDSIDLDNMSLDELYALRDEITGADQSGGNYDFSFEWDGSPTYDTSLDEETEPDMPVKTLKR